MTAATTTTKIADAKRYLGRKSELTQQAVERVTDPAVIAVLDTDLTTPEMEEKLGRPLSTDEIRFACRAKWNRHYAPHLNGQEKS